MSPWWNPWRPSDRDLLIKILRNQENYIMPTQAEILAKLAAQSDQMDQVIASLDGIQADITALKLLIANGASLDDISAAVDALGGKVTTAQTTASGIDAQTDPNAP